MRTTLVRHTRNLCTLLLTLHHIIGDGFSGAYLMRDLIQAASMVESGETPMLPPLPARRELETYFPQWVKGLSGRRQYWRLWCRVLAPIFRYGRPANLKIEQKASLRPGRAHFISRMLEPKLVRALSKKARQEHTTVHGALGSAIILALAQDEGSGKDRLYLVGSPVNLRSRLCAPIKDDVGFFVTMGLSIGLACHSTEFWPLARDFRESLSQCVMRGGPFVFQYQQKDLNFVTSLMGTGPRGRRTYARFVQLANPGAWGLSNIGRVAVKACQGPLNIESLGISMSCPVWFRFASFAATLKDQMTWNFVSMSPGHMREQTERLADLAVEILTKAVKDN